VEIIKTFVSANVLIKKWKKVATNELITLHIATEPK